jgi:hypothetical protein
MTLVFIMMLVVTAVDRSTEVVRSFARLGDVYPAIINLMESTRFCRVLENGFHHCADVRIPKQYEKGNHYNDNW